MAKDQRTAAEKAKWKAGEFTEAEAKEVGMSRAQKNKERERQERALGNPLAPPA